MPIIKAEVVIVTDPISGSDKRIAGLRRRECGTFTVKAGAISKSFTDYEFSTDFMLMGDRHRSVLCRASDFADKVFFNRETGQWVNPALEFACEKLQTYRRNAAEGTGPTGRKEEQRHEEQQRSAKLEALRKREILDAQRNITIGALVIKYDDFIKPKLKSYASTKTHLERIMADLGTLPLRELTLALVEEWQTTLAFSTKRPKTVRKPKPTERISPVTVNRYLQTFKAMCTKASDWGLISERKLREIRKIKLADERHNRRLDFLSRDESERLIDMSEPAVRPIIICALQTGMRKGEILGLKWTQVDLTHRLIHLHKTKSGDPRSLPINDRLDTTLRRLVRDLKDDHVFINLETGTRWSDLKRSFRRAVTQAKLAHRGIVFHHLRHTAASWMVMAGVPLLTVAKILGHSDVKMVMRYSHLSPQHLEKAVATLDSSTDASKSPAENSSVQTAVGCE